MAESSFYIGIDIDDKYAVTSYYSAGMKEPATVSMVTGSEVFQIPVLITRKNENNHWVIGEDAKQQAKEQQTMLIDCLLQKALEQKEIVIDEEGYKAEDLLVFFFRKLISYAGSMQGMREPEGLAVTVPEVTGEILKLFNRVGEKLHIQF